MLELSGLDLRAHGERLRFHDHPPYHDPVRFRLSRAYFRTASMGEAPVYLHAGDGVRDRSAAVFSLYCYFDQETARALRHRPPLLAKPYAVEVEGRLLHWTHGIGVEMTDCRLLRSETTPEP